MTKDERFLVELYRTLNSSGNLEAGINPQQLAKKLGYKELLTKDILKGLRQANFIIIDGPEEIAITQRGIDVARSLLSS